jgi:hypothetical protein
VEEIEPAILYEIRSRLFIEGTLPAAQAGKKR